MRRYFDAHLYDSNFGSRVFSLRFRRNWKNLTGRIQDVRRELGKSQLPVVVAAFGQSCQWVNPETETGEIFVAVDPHPG